MIDDVLNNARRLQTASEAYLHDAVVVDGIRPPVKPDKRRVAEVAQPKWFAVVDRVGFPPPQGPYFILYWSHPRGAP